MIQVSPESLKPFAAKYIWWQTPEEAVRRPQRVMAQVMDIGDFEDVLALEKMVGDEVLIEVLKNAEAGWFRPRSWNFWHLRLDLIAPLEDPPPLPTRKLE